MNISAKHKHIYILFKTYCLNKIFHTPQKYVIILEMKYCKILAFTFLSISPYIANASYSDISMGKSIYPAVEYLAKKQFATGYADGTFGDKKSINRAETLKLILVAIEEPLISGDSTFSDVPTDAWFAPYVVHAKTKGIVSGDPDGTFSPARQVNRAEYIKIILKAFDVDLSTYTLNKTISDVPENAWFAPYMKFSVQFNILDLDESGLAHPGKFVTRGEAANILYQTLKQGRGLDPQVLINLTEEHLIYALKVLQTNELLNAGIGINVAQKFVKALMILSPKHPMILIASDTTNSIQNLIGAYVAAQNGLLDDVIFSAKNAWEQADKIQNSGTPSTEQMAMSIKKLSKGIADKAREIKESIE